MNEFNMTESLKNYFRDLPVKDVLIIFFTAFFVRIISMMLFGSNNLIGPDSGEYDTYAVNLLKDCYFHYGNVRAFRAPLYPFFISMIYFLFGHSYIPVKLIQCFLGSLTCVLVFLIGFEITNRKIASIAGFIACFYFALFDNSAYISTETLFTFLLALSVLLIYRSGWSNIVPLISGISIGLSALTRPTTLILPPLAAVWFFVCYNFRKAFLYSLILFLGFFAVLTPWAIRNYKLFSAFIPVNIQSGTVFWAGNNQWSNGRVNQENLGSAKYDSLTEFERDKAYFSEGLRWLKSQSAFSLFKLYSLKFVSVLYPFLPEFKTMSGSDFFYKYDPTFGFVIPFWIYGMYICLVSKNKNSILMFAVLSIFVFSSLMFYGGDTRFRTAYSPYVAIFAAMGISNLLSRFYGRNIIFIWGAANIAIFYFSQYIYASLYSVIWKIRGL